jgi:hypothetical protein
MSVRGATTAIGRKAPPAPLAWLHSHDLIKGRALDYGCGRNTWYSMAGYDPHWRPMMPVGKFDTITCVYVLNVVPEAVQHQILKMITTLLKPGGKAFVAVRRDLPRAGRAGRGTTQRYVTLKWPSVRRTSGYEIYVLRK